MSVVVATKEEVQEYYLSEALGQSKLKLLLGDLTQFNKEFDSSAEHFLIGSAVDCILTSSREQFNTEYYTSEVEKLPSDAIIEILKKTHAELLLDYAEQMEVITTQEETGEVISFADYVGKLEDHTTYLLDAAEQAQWQPRWGAEAKVKNLLEAGSAYFEDLCKSFGRKVISKTQAELIDSIVLSLETNPRTSNYFDRQRIAELENITVYYQFPIYFTYRGVDCKALLDMVIVVRDVEGKIIRVQGVDLKTMNGNTYYFPNSIKARRYDIQAAWYTMALIEYFALELNPTVVSPFKFVVESTSFQGKPLVFEVDASLLKMGKQGRKTISLLEVDDFVGDMNAVIQHEIKGYEQLLDMYIYHTENGFIEREIQEAGLEPLKVDWNGYI